MFGVFSLYMCIYILFPLCGGIWRLNELFVRSYVAVVLQLYESISDVPAEHRRCRMVPRVLRLPLQIPSGQSWAEPSLDTSAVKRIG